MSFSMQGSVQIVPRLTDGNATVQVNANRQLVFIDGTGAGEADAYWSKTYEISAGQSQAVDLRALSVSVLGATGTLVLDTVKHFLVFNQSAETSLTVGPGAVDGWDGLAGDIPVGRSGTLMLHSPVSGVAASSVSRTVSITNTDVVHTLTGNTTSGQKAITGLSSTTSLEVGMLVAGTGIPSGATIASITNGTSVQLSANATATGTGVSLTFRRPPATVEIHVVGVED